MSQQTTQPDTAAAHSPEEMQQGSKMWSGRFREPLDAAFEQWQRSFPFDWRLLPSEIAASKAHAQTIADAGILSADELATMLRGLDTVGANAVRGAAIVTETPVAEDIHHYVELTLRQEIGDLALKLHTGRSRNEQIATDLRLYLRDAIDTASTQLCAWAASLLRVAERSGEAVMPGYTHLQRAEPVLIAHWLLAYVAMVERDLSRLADCRKRLNQCPLGSGAIAGATLAIDRFTSAKILAFEGPTTNSMDATSDRDFALEFSQVAQTISLHLSRFAEEITLFSTAEYGFIDLPERFSTGSSAMPQKKNPDLTELLRGKAARITGSSVAFAMLLKGLPLAYNKDLQETQEASFAVVETLLSTLPLLAPFTEALGLRLNRMEQAAQTGYLNAMAAATYLVHKGVPFRTAHEQIGRAVRYALELGVELDQLTLEQLRSFGEHFDEGFLSSLSVMAAVDCHDVVGGTNRARVKASLEAAKERVASLEVEQKTGVLVG